MNDERLDHLIRFYSFCTLTQNVKGKRKVFHSAGQVPAAPRLHAREIRHQYSDELAI